MNPPNNTNPFVGLRPFESDESLLFFGRQEQTLELLQRLHEHHFVAVIGNSGCGKSSLIRGGLIPRLKAGYLVDDLDRWMITMMKPGHSPLYNLADAILNQLSPGSNNETINGLEKKIREEGAGALLDILKPLWEEHTTNFFLLVDQFEELFRFSMDQKEAEKKDEAIDFVSIMLELSRQTDMPIYIVMTMRADFIGDCAQFYGLPEAMNQSQYLVPRLNRSQLKNAIEGPVKLYGGSINPALTSRLLNDAVALKDELPLLQHALMRIWDQETKADKNNELDLDDYEKIGGIEKALSKHADEALEDMSEDELALTKKIFQALTIIDENGRKVRRPVFLSELETLTGKNREQLLAVINRFSEEKRSFIIVNKAVHSNEELIDISHESLIRQWNTLSTWVDEEAESSRIYLRLKESAELYGDKKKDLLKGSEFGIAMQWYKSFDSSSAWAQKYTEGFEKSVAYLLESEKELKITELKNKATRRNKIILIFSSAVLLLIAFSFYLISSRSESQRKRESEIKEAFRLNSLAQDWLDVDPTIALRIEDAAMQKFPDSVIRKVSQQIYLKNTFYKIIVKGTSFIPAVAFSRDGTKILTGSYDSVARIWNLEGKMEREFRGHTGSIYAVAFSPDGTKVLTGSADHTAILWNMDGQPLKVFKGHTDSIYSVAFSKDGTKILTGCMDSTAIVWSIDGTLIRKLPQHPDGVKSAVFSPDGTKILTGCFDGIPRLWNVEGKLVKQFPSNPMGIACVDFSPDGSAIIAGYFDYKARLWNMNGDLLAVFDGHKGVVKAIAFSPDGNRILTGSFDHTAILWDLKGNILKELKGHTDHVRSVAFSPDGTKVLTGSEDHTARLWDVDDHQVKEFRGYTGTVNAVAFSRDGTQLLTGCFDSLFRLWNLNGSLLKEFKWHAARIVSIAFSPDGTRALTGSTDNIIRLWGLDSDTIRFIREFKGHTAPVRAVAFSPDGTKILSASEDHTARLWDVNGNLISTFKEGHTGMVIAAIFSPDGTQVLTGSEDYTAILWNVDGTLITRFKGHKFFVTAVAFSPDGTKVLTGSEDHSARLWDLNGDLLREYKEQLSAVNAIAFSPDGNRIVTASSDQTINIWSVDGTLLEKLKGHAGSVTSIAFSPDGTKILTGGGDKTARLWDARVILLEDFWKSDKIDKLTDEQKKEFGIK